MPVGLKPLAQLPEILGLRIGVAPIESNRRAGRLTLFELTANTTVAVTQTQNSVRAAPVLITEQHIGAKNTAYLVINSGNANACTGEQGYQNAIEICNSLAMITHTKKEQILPFSTGVIGEHIDVDAVKQALPIALRDLRQDGWNDAAKMIMTTDTVAKGYSVEVCHQDKHCRLTGIVKGAGMIKPNMATMLCFIGTDAKIDNQLLKELLDNAIAQSFHTITVDGDTSTNDACALMATGQSGLQVNAEKTEMLQKFQAALDELTLYLAEAIIRDAEGASKFIKICIEQGMSGSECEQTAFTIAHSPLVKTALFASDPNWGRIIAAVGRAGIKDLDVNKLEMYIGENLVMQRGQIAPSYNEASAQQAMSKEDITIRVVLNRGTSNFTVRTSDLSHDYVSINADYRS